MEEALKRCICKNNSIVNELDSLKDEMRNFHENCNVAKTVGTTATVAGTATAVVSICLAPFTGGTSLLVGGASLAASVGGGITNIVTNEVDRRKTQEIIEKLQSMVRDKNKFDRDLKKILDNFNEIVQELVKTSHMDAKKAIYAALLGEANGFIDLTNSNIKNNLKLTINSGLIRSSIEILAVDSIKLGEKEILKFGSFIGLAKDTLRTIGTALALASVVFTVVEVNNLINSWNSHHPTIDTIMELKKQICNETTQFQEILDILDRCKERISLTTIDNYDIFGSQLAVDILSAYLQNDLETWEQLLKSNNIHVKEKRWFKAILLRGIENFESIRTIVKEIMKKRGKNAGKAVQMLFTDVVQWIEQKSKDERETKKKRSKRGEHVINNGVLDVYSDVIDEFSCTVFGLSFEQLGICQSSLLYQDYYDPISTSNTLNIESNLIAHIPREYQYFDANEVLYGTSIHLLRQACVEHMRELYKYPNRPKRSGTDHSTKVKKSVQFMNNIPCYVDFVALSFYLSNGGSRVTYESAKSEVHLMFENLYENMGKWVEEFRRH